MTNRLALIIFVCILALLGLLAILSEDAPLFLARKFAALLEWVAFWR